MTTRHSGLNSFRVRFNGRRLRELARTSFTSIRSRHRLTSRSSRRMLISKPETLTGKGRRNPSRGYRFLLGYLGANLTQKAVAQSCNLVLPDATCISCRATALIATEATRIPWREVPLSSLTPYVSLDLARPLYGAALGNKRWFHLAQRYPSSFQAPVGTTSLRYMTGRHIWSNYSHIRSHRLP